MRPLEPCFCNAVWHLRSLSARSSLGDLRSSLQVVPPRRRFWRLLARVVLVCFGVVPSLPWAISRAGSGRTGSSRRALHGPQNLLGIGDWLLLPTNSAAILLAQYLSCAHGARRPCPSGWWLSSCAHCLSTCPRARRSTSARATDGAGKRAFGNPATAWPKLAPDRRVGYI